METNTPRPLREQTGRLLLVLLIAVLYAGIVAAFLAVGATLRTDDLRLQCAPDYYAAPGTYLCVERPPGGQ